MPQIPNLLRGNIRKSLTGRYSTIPGLEFPGRSVDWGPGNVTAVVWVRTSTCHGQSHKKWLFSLKDTWHNWHILVCICGSCGGTGKCLSESLAKRALELNCLLCTVGLLNCWADRVCSLRVMAHVTLIKSNIQICVHTLNSVWIFQPLCQAWE